jgi:glutamyl-tRNA reductase
VTERPVWAAVAAADRFSAATREGIATWARAFGVASPDSVLVVTCHRVELYGSGEDPMTASRFAGDAASHATTAAIHRPEIIEGVDAVRHLCRLAAGLESAVVGEDQVLHQVRTAFATAATRGPMGPDLARMFELAIGVGRRTRAGQKAPRRDLGDVALAWLESVAGSLDGRRLLIAGAGPMGQALAAAGRRRRANVVVASRSRARALAVASLTGADAMELGEAAAAVGGFDAVAVALAGPWLELDAAAGLPPMVDLSFPASVGAGHRQLAGDRFADVDALFALGQRADEGEGPIDGPAGGGTAVATAAAAAVGSAGRGTAHAPHTDAYIRRADALVEQAVERYRVWAAGRRSVETLRSLRERAETRRARDLERLLRRLPELDPRQRALVEAFSEQLVAGLLHGPTSVLRDDQDGSAARAAERLFRL